MNAPKQRHAKATKHHGGSFRSYYRTASAAVLVSMVAAGCSSTGTTAPAASSASPPRSGESGTQECTQDNVLTCTGPNRHDLLVSGARKEGTIIWDTTLRTTAVEPLVAAFKKLYPFIKVKYKVGTTQTEITSIEAAARANRYDVDLVDSTIGPQTLASAGLMQPYYSPNLSMYPSAAKSNVNGPVSWTAEVRYYLVAACNTNELKGSQIPKTYSDLLAADLKGKKIAVSVTAGSGGPYLVGILLKSMGEKKAKAFLSKLSKQDLAILPQGGPTELQAVESGQYAVGLMTFNEHVFNARKAGAPVVAAYLEPVPGLISQVGILKNAKHPDAAMLLLNFIISKAGQQVLAQAGNTPALLSVKTLHPKLSPLTGHWKELLVPPAEVAKKTDEWGSLFKQYFG